MSGRLKVSKIAELSLGKIGAFTVNQVSPDTDELYLTVQWLDIIVAALAGTRRCFWLTPATVTKALSANTTSYVLSTLLGTSYPTDGILFPTAAYIRDASSDDTEIELISRREYEALANKDATGEPTKAYIDRLADSQVIYLYPTPTTTDYSLRLTFQTYPPTLTGGTPENAGNRGHGFTADWQLWLITALAAEIGDGPVRRLPTQEVRDMRGAANDMLERLLTTYANTEKTTSPRRVKPAF